jgi:hypothetical protein
MDFLDNFINEILRQHNTKQTSESLKNNLLIILMQEAGSEVLNKAMHRIEEEYYADAEVVFSEMNMDDVPSEVRERVRRDFFSQIKKIHESFVEAVYKAYTDTNDI